MYVYLYTVFQKSRGRKMLNFTLKFTYTKNLNFISHNLLPGEPSLRFTFKSKERKTFPVLTLNLQQTFTLSNNLNPLQGFAK